MSSSPAQRTLVPLPRVTIGVVCSIGLGPTRGGRARNEDNYLICREGQVRFREGDQEVVRDQPGAGVMVAVADGMGGHLDGAAASTAGVRAFASLFARGRPSAPELALHRFLLQAHGSLHETARRSGPVQLGTTLTAAWLLDHRLFWVHVGDSRLYHFREGSLVRITADHTLGEFARRDRRPPPREPHRLAQSFLYGSRGLGDDAAIRIDPGRDTGSLNLEPGDTLLLCTDGLTGWVSDERIVDALRDVSAPAACAEVLVERALAGGSDDNTTVMVLRVEELDTRDQASEPAELPPRPDDTIVPE